MKNNDFSQILKRHDRTYISDNQKGYPHCRGMAVVIRIVPFSCNFFFIDRDKWNFFRYLEKKTKSAVRNAQ